MQHLLHFPIVRIATTNGEHLNIPIWEKEVSTYGQQAEKLAEKFKHSFQKEALNKGKFESLYHYQLKKDMEQIELNVPFESSKFLPSFSFQTIIYFRNTAKGFWGIVPELGIEGFGIDLDALNLCIIENIQLAFLKDKRLEIIEKLIEAIWYGERQLETHTLRFKIPSPSELEKDKKEERKKIIDDVAVRLYAAPNQVAFERTKDVERILDILKGKFKKNILLVGRNGVGKSAIIQETLRAAKANSISLDFRETTASQLIKGLTGETGWQDNILFLCKELNELQAMLFVKNIMELFEVGQYEGNAMSIADFLTNALASGQISIISECTEDEFAKIELRNPTFLNLFEVIKIVEEKDKLATIIHNKMASYSKKIDIDPEGIQESIRLFKRFSPYAGFPGKPIRFLESLAQNARKSNTLGSKAIIEQFCEETGMPTFMVDHSIPMDLKKVKTQFKNELYGQDVAVDALVDTLSTVKTSLSKLGKPIASMLFVGPTGVGKTELAKLLAEFMFGSREKMIRFDMSEYASPYSVLRLTGESAFSDGLLTAAVRRTPFCVLLFDEIEKAHPAFFDLLLQVLGEGRLSDSRGQLVDFCSTIIIMTSNIGAGNLSQNRIRLNKEVDNTEVQQHFVQAVEKHFRPELFNRIDKILPFKPLSRDDVRFVVEREIELLKKREGLQFRKVSVRFSNELMDFIAELGYSPKFGARYLQRTVAQEIITPLSKILNQQDIDEQLSVEIVLKDGAIHFEHETDPLQIELLFEELSRNNLTDQVSASRRYMNSLLSNSGLYLSVLSNYQRLERQQKREKQKFWAKGELVKDYQKHLSIKQTGEALLEEISEMETEMALSIMDLQAFRSDFDSKVDGFEQSFFGFKKQLYQVAKGHETTYLYGYGNHCEALLDFYKALCDKLSWKYKVAMLVHIGEGNESLSSNSAFLEFPEATYASKAIREQIKKTNGQGLIGFEMRITGDCSFLYLLPEVGLQHWQMDSKKLRYKFQVDVQSEAKAIPKEVLEQLYYSQKRHPLRRTRTMAIFKDRHFRMEKEVDFDSHLDLLMDILNEWFVKNLDDAVM